MSGKGDTPRPMSVTQDEYKQNFDRIFRSKVKDEITVTVGDDVVTTTADDSSKAISAEDRQRYYEQSYRDTLR